MIENSFLENGIPQDKFMRIPITVDLNKFDLIQIIPKMKLENFIIFQKILLWLDLFKKMVMAGVKEMTQN